MPLPARRVFRLALVMALSAVAAFVLGLKFSFMPPVMAVLLTALPLPPPRPKAVLVLMVVIVLTTGVGLLMIPLLLHYPLTAVLLVGLGVYVSAYLMVGLRQDALGIFLATGFVLVSVMGVASEALARAMIEGMATGAAVAVFCQWLVAPLFPEEPTPSLPSPSQNGTGQADWIALRGTLVVLPVWLAALHAPFTWAAALTKALTIGQQRSYDGARLAGLELVGSTFTGGLLAVVFWLLLGILPNLWILFLLALLAGLYGGGKLFGVLPSRFPATFWSNSLVTMWILLAPAVSDSEVGKDVYQAFFQRFMLFLGVTLYAWAALVLLESWRARYNGSRRRKAPDTHAAIV